MQVVDWSEAASRLAAGEVGVIPTDTLYGVVGLARKPAVVERIYELRARDPDKPLIVLVGAWDDLDGLGIAVSERVRGVLKRVWPGPVSAVLAVPDAKLAYLHRGTQSIAFRMPAKRELRSLLELTGPIVAPSANLAGEEPALTVAEAYRYFGEDIFYVDEGSLSNPASALVDVRTQPAKVLRPAPGFEVRLLEPGV